MDDTGGLKKKRQNLLGASLIQGFLVYKYCVIQKAGGLKLFLIEFKVDVYEFLVITCIFNIYFFIRYIHALHKKDPEDQKSGLSTWRELIAISVAKELSELNNEVVKEEIIKQTANGFELMFYEKNKIKQNYQSILKNRIINNRFIENDLNLTFEICQADEPNNPIGPAEFILNEDTVWPKEFNSNKWFLSIKHQLITHFSSSLEYIFPIILFIIAWSYMFVDYIFKL